MNYLAYNVSVLTNPRPEEESPATTPENRLFSRLDRLEELLLDVKAQTQTQTPSASSSLIESPVLNRPVPSTIASPSRHGGSGVIVGFDLHSLSSLENDSCHPALLPLHTTDFEERLQSELLEGDALFHGEAVGLDMLDLAPRHCWQLQQAFSRHMLPWRPIIDQQVCAQLLNRALDCNFMSGGLDTSLTLFMLALGSIAQESRNTCHDAATMPGIGYFRAACQLVDSDRVSMNTLRYVQCQIMMCFYFISSIRPVQAFQAIRIASDKIVMLLQLRSRIASDRIYGDLCARAYWACYSTEYELQPYIAYSTCFFQNLHEVVPLPTSDYDEPGLYSFLSEIALRRIVSRAWNGVSWNRAMLLDDPVRHEILLQLTQWQENLPSPVKFNLDDLSHPFTSSSRTLREPHNDSLRAYFYSLRAILLWPNVVRLLSAEVSATSDNGEAAQKYYMMVQDAAASLHCSVMYINALEPLVQTRNLMVTPSSVVLYATMLMLLCTYGEPALKEVQHRKTVEALWIGWRCMKLWETKPAFKGGVEKVEHLFAAKGIGLPSQPQQHRSSEWGGV